MNRPRGTPTITSREPLAVAVATGRKSDRGFPVDTHRFFLVNERDMLPVAERPFGAAATIAEEKGGAEAKRWANLDYGQWPTEPTE